MLNTALAHRRALNTALVAGRPSPSPPLVRPLARAPPALALNTALPDDSRSPPPTPREYHYCGGALPTNPVWSRQPRPLPTRSERRRFARPARCDAPAARPALALPPRALARRRAHRRRPRRGSWRGRGRGSGSGRRRRGIGRGSCRCAGGLSAGRSAAGPSTRATSRCTRAVPARAKRRLAPRVVCGRTTLAHCRHDRHPAAARPVK